MSKRSRRKARRAALSAADTQRKGQVEQAPVKIRATAEEGETPAGPPTFEAVAYSGGLVPGHTSTPRLPHPYVIDLASAKVGRKMIANLDHKRDRRVGHVGEHVNDGKELRVAGVLSAATPHRDEVAGSAANGFEWEVSIEADLAQMRKVPAGKSVTVNGRTFNGPVYVAAGAVFDGLGFVSQGADDGNQLSIAATADERKPMNKFEEFIVSCGHDPESVEDSVRVNLEQLYELQQRDGSHRKEQVSFSDRAAQIRAEKDRKDCIERIALTAMKENPLLHDQIEQLAAAAIESETTIKDFELELMRGTRVQAGAFQQPNKAESDPDVIEAALALSAGMPNVEKHYSERVLNTVEKSGLRNFGLQQLLMRVAASNGYPCRAGDRIHAGNIRAVLEYCFPPATARLSTGFSNVSLPGILGAVANKELLMGYMEEDQTWREFAAVKPVNNLQQVTSYRMLDDLEYEEIGPNGEIHHGTLDQESYTRQAKTYAKMAGLSRTDILNDDLGAFDDLRTRLGRGASKKFNNIFWAAFMNNALFFTAARTNYIEGAASNLGIDGVGLQLGITAYRKMTTPAGDGSKRIGASGGRPTKLLVPPELEFIARRHYQSLNTNIGGAATAESVGDANVHAGLYRPVVQNRLSDAAFTGNSATAWYLFGDEMKPMVVSFLNGQQAPTVESTDADFSVLGIMFRGFHDFGADKSEYLSGVKSKGAA